MHRAPAPPRAAATMATAPGFLSPPPRARTTSARRATALCRAERGGAASGPRADDPTLAALCDSGLPDPDVCDVSRLPPKEGATAVAEAWARGRWLLGLLVLQSTSSFVLDAYAPLLRDHLVITLFLTMLVGAGGNAGNQSAIHVIRGLATGSITTAPASVRATLARQAAVGALLAAGLAAGGYARVFASTGSAHDAAAISASLAAIVLASVVVGSALPFALARAGVDPANAGTSVQVVMDILGCVITCVTCQAVLGSLAGAVGVVAGG